MTAHTDLINDLCQAGYGTAAFNAQLELIFFKPNDWNVACHLTSDGKRVVNRYINSYDKVTHGTCHPDDYTTNTDVAVRLVRKHFPEAYIVLHYGRGICAAVINHIEAEAETLPLAICAALLMNQEVAA